MDLTPSQKTRREKLRETLEQEGEIGLIKYVLEMEDKFEEQMEKITEENKSLSGGPMEVAQTIAKNILKDVKGDKGDAPTEEELLKIIQPLIPNIPEVIHGEDYVLTDEDKQEIASKIEVPVVEKVIEKTEVIKEQPIVTHEVTNEIKEVAITDTGEEMVIKINALEIEPEKQIGVEHIKGLEKRLKGIENKPSTPGGGIVGRDLIKDIDLSDQLDGVLATFNIPVVWNIVSVDLSSYPYGSLRKNIDYTWTPTSITFTSEIDPATQLSVGQKCILTVVTG